MYLKPGNFSDPRKIASVTVHLLLIFQIVNVDFIFLEYKLTVNVHLSIRQLETKQKLSRNIHLLSFEENYSCRSQEITET